MNSLFPRFANQSPLWTMNATSKWILAGLLVPHVIMAIVFRGPKNETFKRFPKSNGTVSIERFPHPESATGRHSDLESTKRERVHRESTSENGHHREIIDFFSLPSVNEDHFSNTSLTQPLEKKKRKQKADNSTLKLTPIVFHLGQLKPKISSNSEKFQGSNDKVGNSYNISTNFPHSKVEREEGTLSSLNASQNQKAGTIYSISEISVKKNDTSETNGRTEHFPRRNVTAFEKYSADQFEQKLLLSNSDTHDPSLDELNRNNSNTELEPKEVENSGGTTSLKFSHNQGVESVYPLSELTFGKNDSITRTESRKLNRGKSISSNFETFPATQGKPDFLLLSNNSNNYKANVSYFVANSSLSRHSDEKPEFTFSRRGNVTSPNITNLKTNLHFNASENSQNKNNFTLPPSESEIFATKLNLETSQYTSAPLSKSAPTTKPTVEISQKNKEIPSTIPVSPARVQAILDNPFRDIFANSKASSSTNPFSTNTNPVNFANGFGNLNLGFREVSAPAISLGSQTNPFLDALGINYLSLLGGSGPAKPDSADNSFSISPLASDFSSESSNPNLGIASLFPSLSNFNFNLDGGALSKVPRLVESKTQSGFNFGDFSLSGFPSLSFPPNILNPYQKEETSKTPLVSPSKIDSFLKSFSGQAVDGGAGISSSSDTNNDKTSTG